MNSFANPIEQMELTLDAVTRVRRSTRPSPTAGRFQPRRHAVSRWWFARMREVVQSARDWPIAEGSPVPQEARQVDLALAPRPTRFVRVPVAAGRDCPLPVGPSAP